MCLCCLPHDMFTVLHASSSLKQAHCSSLFSFLRQRVRVSVSHSVVLARPYVAAVAVKPALWRRSCLSPLSHSLSLVALEELRAVTVATACAKRVRVSFVAVELAPWRRRFCTVVYRSLSSLQSLSLSATVPAQGK